ncbi:MAG: hypothetical protein PHU63_04045, partial [Candidatus ainarchaeum sp.]|nr:hypothetical protein [Candidatus ainarchaeum sp.]
RSEKIKLDKYLNVSDTNISDLFDKIIEGYRTGKDISKLLEKVKHERMALLRAGIRAINQGAPYFKISKSQMAYYLLKMIFDQDWKMVFKNLLIELYNEKTNYPIHFVAGVSRIYREYTDKANEWIEELIGNMDNEEIVSLISEMNNEELVLKLKRQIMFIARDDVGKNKSNAISALSSIWNDEDVIKLLIVLLKRKDEETQNQILNALILKGKISNQNLFEQIKEIEKTTANPYIRNLAKRLIG